MGAPQYIILGLAFAQVVFEATINGQPYPRKAGLWPALINEAVILSLLYWGGFFGGLEK